MIHLLLWVFAISAVGIMMSTSIIWDTESTVELSQKKNEED